MFEVNIAKHMCSGDGTFVLRAQFATSDKALVLFGPSGSGKTLTLRCVAGMLAPDEGYIACNGKVWFDGANRVNVPTRKRHIGYVFQDYALFPHLTVRQNIAFGLTSFGGRVGRQEALRVEELIHSFHLEAVAELRPVSLSGGQQQRTALARALAPDPELLLLDEPFSALDQPLRVRMRHELVQLLETVDIPVIMVTHDLEEVGQFAETVAVYRDGAVVDVYSAQQLVEEGRSMQHILEQQVASAYD